MSSGFGNACPRRSSVRGAISARQNGAKIAIGANITKVQTMFREIFHATDVTPDGSVFDQRFKEGEHFAIGNLDVEVIYTPGHTPGCVSYKIGNNVFVGDTMFMPDYGTARADFPGGDARVLYRSIRKLLALPPETNLWMCHDYQTPERDTHAWQTSVGEQRAKNIHVHDGVSEDELGNARSARQNTGYAGTDIAIHSGQYPRRSHAARRR